MFRTCGGMMSLLGSANPKIQRMSTVLAQGEEFIKTALRRRYGDINALLPPRLLQQAFLHPGGSAELVIISDSTLYLSSKKPKRYGYFEWLRQLGYVDDLLARTYGGLRH